jgi:hypothetical protein
MPMISAPNGSYIPPSKVYSNPGIVRDSNKCSYRSGWQAYECHGLNYQMMVIERYFFYFLIFTQFIYY